MSPDLPDDDLERRLRDVLHDRGLGVPTAPDALDRVHAGARRRQQRGSTGAVLGAVAIIGAAAAGISLRPHSHPTTVVADRTPSPSLSSPSAAPASSPIASADPKPFASNAVVLPSASVPAANSFSPLSVTAIGPTTYWVLLAGSGCDCMTLKMTSDGGQTFSTLQAPAGKGAKGWTASVIRFANATDGWAFQDADSAGPSLFTTTDGGRSWSETKQFAGRVVDLVAANGKAWAVVDTTPDNQQVPTQFALYMTSYGQAPEAWIRVSLPIDLGSTLPAIVDQDGTVTVLASGPARANNKVHVLIAAPGGPFTDHTGPCEQDLGGYLSNSATGVWAICPTGHMAGVSVSTDRGASWKSVQNLPPPSLPDPGRGGFGAIDDTHALVYDPATSGLVRVTVGSSPQPVTSGPAAVGVGTVFIGFTTPSTGFLVTFQEDSTGELWRTTDGGTTWAMVDFGA
jgi:hypothetical protein